MSEERRANENIEGMGRAIEAEEAARKEVNLESEQ